MAESKLIFEIGTEEIPSEALYKATDQLAALATKALDDAGLAHGTVKTCSTPRRMILSVDAVAAATQAVSNKAKGPAAQIAFDADGNPTKAAEGFARGKGLTAADLTVEADEKGVEYVYAVVEKPAVAATDLLPAILSSLIKGLSWPRSQRWGSRHETFSRPVRWLVALLGEQVIPVEFAGLTAGRTTYGHRFLAPQAVKIASADDFFSHFVDMKVVPSAAQRDAIIREQIAAFEAQTGLRADTPQSTYREVVNLVEYPTVILSHFDEEFLQVPPEIITDAMLEHQRYFPMYRKDGSLDNAFLVVGNGDPACTDTIRDGNERVVRARLSDAAFFVAEDRRRPLESYVDDLEVVTFQEKLGSVKAKVQRIQAIAAKVCDGASVQGQEREDAIRAALLCKADLVTGAVVEFTSLQGVMGGHYARFSGETDGVAAAITEHYHPRFSGDAVPSTTAGKVVALSDKMDTICGIFAAGMGPTGSSDPYALRRAALGIISIMREGLEVPVPALVQQSLSLYKEQGIEFDVQAVRDEVVDFFITRTKVMLRDSGCAADTVDAVLAAGIEEPMELIRRADALEQARKDDPETFENLAAAFTRANNLREQEAGTGYDPAALNDVAGALSAAIVKAETNVAKALDANDYAHALAELAALRTPIDDFFDKTMIKDEDLTVRTVNMQLLNRFANVFARVADIGKLATK